MKNTNHEETSTSDPNQIYNKEFEDNIIKLQEEGLSNDEIIDRLSWELHVLLGEDVSKWHGAEQDFYNLERSIEYLESTINKKERAQNKSKNKKQNFRQIKYFFKKFNFSNKIKEEFHENERSAERDEMEEKKDEKKEKSDEIEKLKGIIKNEQKEIQTFRTDLKERLEKTTKPPLPPRKTTTKPPLPPRKKRTEARKIEELHISPPFTGLRPHVPKEGIEAYRPFFRALKTQKVTNKAQRSPLSPRPVKKKQGALNDLRQETSRNQNKLKLAHGKRKP